MYRAAFVGAVAGAIFGVTVVALTATGHKVFLILSLPGASPVVLFRGVAALPSLAVSVITAAVYATGFAFLALLWSAFRMNSDSIRRERRLRLMNCGQCGYDLTGNVSGTCPECGTVVEKLMTDGVESRR